MGMMKSLGKLFRRKIKEVKGSVYGKTLAAAHADLFSKLNSSHLVQDALNVGDKVSSFLSFPSFPSLDHSC